MIEYHSRTLDNGLRLIMHQDKKLPLVVTNLLYRVGSRNENPDKTGFAHLFEHLMFGGSANVPNFDQALQNVGGENNAFTSPDLTNYYITLPGENLETALWLESDRMANLNFDPEGLAVQQNVVIEEFKQRYLNQPYGDAWLHLRPLAYQKHPYRWHTIGKEIKHIEDATLTDVEGFFNQFYRPDNATLVVAGNIEFAKTEALVEKWFGDISPAAKKKEDIPSEPEQDQKRTLTLERAVPMDAMFVAFKMPGRMHPHFHAVDLASEILGRGESSRLHNRLVREKKLVSQINAFVQGSVDPGLVVIQAFLNPGASFEEVENVIFEVVHETISGLQEKELERFKNQAATAHLFQEVELFNRAYLIAYGDMLGDAGMINEEPDKIKQVKHQDIIQVLKTYYQESNCSVLYYKSK